MRSPIAGQEKAVAERLPLTLRAYALLTAAATPLAPSPTTTTRFPDSSDTFDPAT